MNFSLSEYSSEVVGWDSTFCTENDVHVRDSSTEISEANVQISEKQIGTFEETKEIGIQASPVVLSNSNEETDQKLAAWLKKILPALEKELSDGPTQVYENRNDNATSTVEFAKISEYQQIDIKSNFPESKSDLVVEHAIFLSVILHNNPVLVVTCSSKESSESSSYMILFEPQRSKSDGNVYWKEISQIQLKENVDFLVVNSENRDIFSGASTSGEFYIWQYEKPSSTNSKSEIIEIFSKVCDDSINGITFISDNTLVCSFSNDGSLMSYKINGKQNCINDKIMKIDKRRLKESHVTAITNVEKSNDFVIGLLNGKLFYCSTNQYVPQDGIIDPVVRELSPHKFAIKSLKYCQHMNKNYIISIDSTCEIFIHEIEDDQNDKSLKFVIRLPLPIKNSIALTNNMEHIFCLLSNGNLEIFNVRKHTRRVIEGDHSGPKSLAVLSKNENWLVTGSCDGIFKMYYVSIE